jgi:hypothetical protein
MSVAQSSDKEIATVALLGTLHARKSLQLRWQALARLSIRVG